MAVFRKTPERIPLIFRMRGILNERKKKRGKPPLLQNDLTMGGYEAGRNTAAGKGNPLKKNPMKANDSRFAEGDDILLWSGQPKDYFRKGGADTIPIGMSVQAMRKRARLFTWARLRGTHRKEEAKEWKKKKMWGSTSDFGGSTTSGGKGKRESEKVANKKTDRRVGVKRLIRQGGKGGRLFVSSQKKGRFLTGGIEGSRKKRTRFIKSGKQNPQM